MAFELSILSVTPRIRSTAAALTATSSWVVRMLSLGAVSRRVVVDRGNQVVRVDHRRFWFWRQHREYPFPYIAAVTYGYEDASFPMNLFPAHDTVDVFVVGLRLHDRTEILLFRFVGDGTFTNNGPLPDWWYWSEYIMDWSGSQERESRMFVQLLSKLLGITIEPSSLT